MNWYLEYIKKNYFNFKGRTSYKEYVIFCITQLLILFALCVIFGGFLSSMPGSDMLGVIFVILAMIPIIPATVRRLHDANYSGWWALSLVFGFIFVVTLIAISLRYSDPNDNKYGPSTKKIS